MFLTESTSPPLTRLLLEDLGPLRVHRVFGVIRRLIDSSLLDDRILHLYHLSFSCELLNELSDARLVHSAFELLTLCHHLLPI